MPQNTFIGRLLIGAACLAAAFAGAEPGRAAEGTADFIDYHDYFADAGYFADTRDRTEPIAQEPVPYESPQPAADDGGTAPAAGEAGMRPAMKREFAPRGKRVHGNETAEAATPGDDWNGAVPAADPSATDAPPGPLPSVSGRAVSVPSVPVDVWSEAGGKEDVPVPVMVRHSDNTPAKPENQERENALFDQDGGCPEAVGAPPTRREVEEYRRRLEMRLLERYNNLPEYAGKVGRVTAVLSKPLELSLDGSMIRAEFDQLVVDPWGKRIPALEEEYYVVTFGTGGARQVRSDPSIRVGLDLEKTYSERAPVSADPFARTPDSRAFRSEPVPASEAATVRMPEWWRPDFPELE